MLSQYNNIISLQKNQAKKKNTEKFLSSHVCLSKSNPDAVTNNTRGGKKAYRSLGTLFVFVSFTITRRA